MSLGNTRFLVGKLEVRCSVSIMEVFTWDLAENHDGITGYMHVSGLNLDSCIVITQRRQTWFVPAPTDARFLHYIHVYGHDSIGNRGRSNSRNEAYKVYTRHRRRPSPSFSPESGQHLIRCHCHCRFPVSIHHPSSIIHLPQTRQSQMSFS